MSLNDTPSAERVHIGLFGRRNAGKSSLINALTGQEVAIVSDIAGTTTDPVSKAMELLPLGPVVFVDTPGLDDDSELGEQRVRRALSALEKIDIALLVVDATRGKDTWEQELEARFQSRAVPYLTVLNKSDLQKPVATDEHEIAVSACTGSRITELRERIAALRPDAAKTRPIVGDLLRPDDAVVLVTPVDSAAPKGRLILPQQQVIRDILDADAQAFVTKENGLEQTLRHLAAPPRMVITDSQAFQEVDAITPREIPLTSFSILFARYKGVLSPSVAAVNGLNRLSDGDKVLISEGCTHHRQCDDIGTVKLPRWIERHTGKKLDFSFSSGGAFQDDLEGYALIVHCGGCMLQERVMRARFASAREQGVPITNYGVLIAHMKGILARSLAVFPAY
ncbi:MAG: [FeFe] hydrogenase H-cluster maturation GTPase HydF [Oscillospiraceae bacterium]|nr:[FeFe] hydrogenase H-cluster maturation GTPase HydF [Oscillospiraceae bacterium]